MDLESLYLLASDQDVSSLTLESSSRSWYPAEPYWHREQLILRRVNFGSPLCTVLDIPWETWSAVGTFFAGAVATVYGLPKAAAGFETHREEFWTKRLRADQAKRAFIDWRKEAAEQRGVELLEAHTPPILEPPAQSPELD